MKQVDGSYRAQGPHHVATELAGQCDAHRATIARTWRIDPHDYSRTTPARHTAVEQSMARPLDRDTRRASGPSTPTFSTVERRLADYRRTLLDLAKATREVLRWLAEAGHPTDDTQTLVVDLSLEDADDLPDFHTDRHRAHAAAILSVNRNGWLAAVDQVQQWVDDPRSWDLADQMVRMRNVDDKTAPNLRRAEHQLHRVAKHCDGALLLRDHPKASRQQVRPCQCGTDCCPDGCSDTIVAQQDRKVHSDRCRKRMQRAKESA